MDDGAGQVQVTRFRFDPLADGEPAIGASSTARGSSPQRATSPADSVEALRYE